MVSDDEAARLARAWDEAAEEYERYLVPRFEPWVKTAVSGLPEELLRGPILVPCCGTFPELPPLAAAHPDRDIVGVDLSPGMVGLAHRRAAAHPLSSAVCGDASDLATSWPGAAAAVVSVFGLQQLPDPVEAITNWVESLRPGGWLSVVYWPPVTELEGPFALLKTVVGEAVGVDPVPDWPDRLAAAVGEAGVRVVHDVEVSHAMSHPDAAAYWSAVTEGGPLRSLVLDRGQAFVDSLRVTYLERSPGGEWHHSPTARWILAARP